MVTERKNSTSVRTVGAAWLMAAVVMAGCAESATAPEVESPTATMTVDTNTAWAFVDLDVPAGLVADSTSADWDIAFNRTSVRLNAAGSGTTGHCVCANSGATDAEVMAMSPDSELPDFEAVKAANVPSQGTAWSATVFGEAAWYRYNLEDNHQIWPTFQVYLVKRGSEVYKIQLINYYNAAGDPRHITIRYARLAE